MQHRFMIAAEMFLVGLSSGGGCLAHCGPTLLPIMLCEEKKRWYLSSVFLATRLITYIVLACILRFAGDASGFSNLLASPYINGGILLLLSLLLGRYAFTMLRPSCNCNKSSSLSTAKARFSLFKISSSRYARRAGFLSATGLCPPMFAFIAGSVASSGYIQLVLSVTGFFLGTTIILLPLLGISPLLKKAPIQKIGMLFCFITAAMYLIQGTSLILKGIYNV